MPRVSCQRAFSCVLVVVALSGWCVALGPLFSGYLDVPNRDLLPWDPAMHFKDGFMLYQQLIQGDLASFLVQIFKFSYWLPLHPLLVCLGCLFGGFSFALPVAINFASLAIGSIWFVVEVLAAFGISSWALAMGLHATLLALSLQMIARGILGDYLGQVMLEILSYGLTLAFMGSAIRAWRTGEMWPIRRASLLLSALFFTKVHYGIYVLLPWLGFLVINGKRSLLEFLSSPGALRECVRTLVRSRAARAAFGIYVILTSVLIGRAIKRGTLDPLHDWVWLQLFAPLVGWTFFGYKERFYSVAGEGWRWLSRYWVIPFGWLYLFPIKHKISTFFELSRHNGPSISLGARAMVLWERLAASVASLDLASTLVICGLCVTVGVALLLRRRSGRWSEGWVGGVLGFLFLFYFMMSFMSHRHEDRVLFPWVAGWVSLLVVGLMALLSGRPRALIVVTWVLASTLFANSVSGRSRWLPELNDRWQGYHLSQDHQGIGKFAQGYRFDQPGIIYGLGMDPVVPLVDLWCRRKFPRMSSYLHSREDSPCFANDFGKDGNADPVGFVVRKVQRAEFKQVSLFQVSGAEKLPELREKLAVAGFKKETEQAGVWELWKRP